MPLPTLRRARLSAQLQAAARGSGGASAIATGRLYRRPHFSVVRLETKGGVAGYGEGRPFEPSEFDAALAVVKDRDATSFEIIRTLLPAGSGVEAAFNSALLDISGKLAKAPIYQVLGGPTRTKVRALAPLQGEDTAALIRSMDAYKKAGYKAFRVPVSAKTGEAVERMKALRAAAGDASDFVLDGGQALTPGQSSTLADSVERLHPLWIDEPCALTNLRAVSKISEECVTPLGFGRDASQIATFQELLREQVVDVLRPSIGRMGISAIRRAATLAEVYYVAVAPYHMGGRIGTAAVMQLAAAIPNFYIADIPLGTASVKDGFAELPTGPGLGIAVDEKELS
jgi:galactonate dehydratase